MASTLQAAESFLTPAIPGQEQVGNQYLRNWSFQLLLMIKNQKIEVSKSKVTGAIFVAECFDICTEHHHTNYDHRWSSVPSYIYFSESEYIGNKIPAKISNARSNAGTNHWPSGSINSQPTLEASKAFKQSLSDIALLNPCIGDFGTLFQWNGTQQQQGPNNFRI